MEAPDAPALAVSMFAATFIKSSSARLWRSILCLKSKFDSAIVFFHCHQCFQHHQLTTHTHCIQEQPIIMPSTKCLFAMAACVSGLVSAEVFKVTAQMSGHFKPDTLRAKVGDVIEFHFEATNHSVVSGDYHNACAPMNLGTGFFSGFFPTENKQSVRLPLTSTTVHLY